MEVSVLYYMVVTSKACNDVIQDTMAATHSPWLPATMCAQSVFTTPSTNTILSSCDEQQDLRLSGWGHQQL